jgi:hypothetical protein
VAYADTKVVFNSESQSRVVRKIQSLSEQSRYMGLNISQDIELLRWEMKGALDQMKADQMSPTGPQDFAQQLSTMRSQCEDIARMNSVLGSLRYDAIYTRHTQIHEAHRKTFEWIFHPNQIRESCSTPPRLNDWLVSQNGIFWVSGKPGSGKSTLMKWLCSHQQTMNSLKVWAGPKRLVTASHFFWSGGTELQRSQQGLLRSLLFDALRASPELIPIVAGDRWQEGDTPALDTIDRPWTISELLGCLNRLGDQVKVPARFCFFIDGLDEYDKPDGDHQDLIDLLKSFAQSDNVKICASSRPWNVYREAFEHQLEWMLKLEDLTKSDIRQFTEDRLGQNAHFQALRVSDPLSQNLIDEIVDAAQGVFLWVFLVVRSLLQGLGNRDRIVFLQKRLRILPRDLNKYFRHILDTTDEIYYEHAARLFMVACEAHEPLSLMTYSYIDEHEPELGIPMPQDPISEVEKINRLCLMRIRLNAQTNGLLECTSSVSSSPPDALIEGWSTRAKRGVFVSPVALSQGFQVQFLHRTVRDFVGTEEIDRLLRSRSGPDVKPAVSISHALLAEIKHLDIAHMPDERVSIILARLLKGLGAYAKDVEVRYKTPLIEVLDEVEGLFQQRPTVFASAVQQAKLSAPLARLSNSSGIHSDTTDLGVSPVRIMECNPEGFDCFIVRTRLLLYLRHKFSVSSSWRQNAKYLILDSFLPTTASFRTLDPTEDDCSMAMAVLGEVPESACSKWVSFLEIVTGFWSDTRSIEPRRDLSLIKKMKLCLEASADPNARRHPTAHNLLWVELLQKSAEGYKDWDVQGPPYRLLSAFLEHGADLHLTSTSKWGQEATAIQIVQDIAPSAVFPLLRQYGYDPQKKRRIGLQYYNVVHKEDHKAPWAE